MDSYAENVIPRRFLSITVLRLMCIFRDDRNLLQFFIFLLIDDRIIMDMASIVYVCTKTKILAGSSDRLQIIQSF